MGTEQNVFGGVFEQLPFPFYSLDLRRLAWGLRIHAGKSSHVALPLNIGLPERRRAVLLSLQGLLKQMDPPAALIDALCAMPFLERNGLVQAFRDMAKSPAIYAIFEAGDTLRWEEQSLWPLAYGTFYSQLSRLLLVHSQLIQERIQAMPGMSIISEYPRQLPTRIHYAVASLAAWAGGAINVQYFGYHAVARQLHDPAVNDDYAQRIGYADEVAESLTASGLVTVPASVLVPLLEAQGESQIPIIGSIPIDETNLANMPAVPFNQALAHELPHPGFLMDKYYRAAFRARELSDYGLYGAHDVLRDHYASFYASIRSSGMVRCKHYCVPVIDVDSLGEIEGIVSSIPIHHRDGIYFRGQGRLYKLNRSPPIRRLLFAGSCSDEPSLLTSASRRPEFDYDRLHFALRHYIEHHIVGDEGSLEGTNNLWQQGCASAACEIDYAILALAQHYGLPTHGLDVTTSSDVAIWFATNRFEIGADQIAGYQTLRADEWSDNPDDWPVVLVCQTVTHSIGQSLHDCFELDQFGIEAQRPRAQHARFFLGGHGDHQNRLAESLVCVLRLRPGVYRTKVTFESLFPPPDKDPAYRLMLAFASRHEYENLGARAVNQFHVRDDL